MHASKLVSLALMLALLGARDAAAPTPLRGYDPAHASGERTLEKRFLQFPSSDGAIAFARIIDARPHFAASPGDYALAVAMRDRLRSFGFEASLESLTTRVDTPQMLSLVLQPAHGVSLAFNLRETASPGDPDPGRRDAGLPFNYGSGDGDVRTPLVYANRGLDRDYATLAAAGVDVRNRLVLVRYGAEFRGLLALRGQRRGAAGVIFYSDPRDDGFGKGPPYPKGPWRPLGSVQRGMVSGPPLAIPTLPVTAQTARILLASIAGRTAPPAWRGALPVTYKLGRTTPLVHLTVKMHRGNATLWNTVGRLRGTTNEEVILGGHRDAWVYGVTDNGAGITTLLEAARGLGALYQSGWRPKRSIVIAGWDGEEIGESGSLTYVKTHDRELRDGCVAYINADENVTGPRFDADAAGALERTVIDVTHAVSFGQPAHTVWSTWRRKPDVPGGGSDHESFLFTLGIPTANMDFNGPFGVYHSSYDDLRYALTQADPGFRYHRVASSLLGIMAMRLADAPVVPYSFAPYSIAAKTGAVALARRTHDVALVRAFSRLRNAAGHLTSASASADARIARGAPVAGRPMRDAARILDLTLYGATGYASTAFPALSAALDAGDAKATARALHDATAALERAAALLHGAARG